MPDVGAGRNGAGAKNNNGQRLIGWKAIGQFLGCTERTARRWESDRALPVRRIPGGSRSSVWANAGELTGWLQALPTEIQVTLRAEAGSEEPASLSAPAPPVSGEPAAVSVPESVATVASGSGALTRRPRWMLAAAAIIALAAVSVAAWEFSLLVRRSAPQSDRTPYDDNAEARELYRTARFEVSTRSASGLTAAERAFRQLVDRYPDRAAGWSGLADSYLLMREFGSMSDEAAYPQAARAAHTALALDPKLADAWLDEAFVSWWWQGDSTAAFRAFDTALRLDPRSARAYHWYATALFAHGDYPQARRAIARARVLEPDNHAIVADEAWIQFAAGEREQGLATLERLAQVDPQFVSWHSYLSHAYLIESRDADYLREARTTAELRGQQDVVAALELAERRLREGGRQAMLDQLASDETQRWERGVGSAVVVAEYRALAGDRPGMLRWLTVAAQRRDHLLPGIYGFPEFAAYASDPAFRQIVAGLPHSTDRVASGE